jgi:hypothetical protein
VNAAQVRVRVDIPHTRRGQQQVTLHFTDASGRPFRPVKVTAEYYEDDKDLGPLPLDLRTGSGGSSAAGDAIVLVPGTWRLRLIVQTSDVDAGIADVLYRVR